MCMYEIASYSECSVVNFLVALEETCYMLHGYSHTTDEERNKRLRFSLVYYSLSLYPFSSQDGFVTDFILIRFVHIYTCFRLLLFFCISVLLVY